MINLFYKVYLNKLIAIFLAIDMALLMAKPIVKLIEAIGK